GMELWNECMSIPPVPTLSTPGPYDPLPSGNGPVPASHIEVLAAEAALAGLSPAPIERCRVLELGCASGGNLLPMADEFPRSQFVGIDISPRQIARGQELIERTGFTNVRLMAMNLMAVGADLGP